LSDTLRGDPKANPYLEPGDIVTLPEADQVYVVGNVYSFLTVPLKEPITLTQAIAMAGGVKQDNKKDRVRIVRQEPGSAARQEIPYSGSEAIGGVQSSARIAWQAVENETRGAATALGYAPGLHPDHRNSDQRIILLRSRNEAIRKAVSRAWPHPKVLVWHLSLLKLLPFLRLSHPKITLMLLGIEAWKSQTGLHSETAR